MREGSRGARVLPDGSGVEFRVWTPRQERMAVRTERGSGWEEHPMVREGDDYVVLVRSSFAGYLADWLLDAALELSTTHDS